METKIFETNSFLIENDVDIWLRNNPNIYIISTVQQQNGINVLLIVIFKYI